MSNSDQSDGLFLLKSLVEIVKNPKLIDEAQERLRKHLEITDEAQKKADENKAINAKNEKLVADLEFQKNSLLEVQAKQQAIIDEANHKSAQLSEDAMAFSKEVDKHNILFAQTAAKAKQLETESAMVSQRLIGIALKEKELSEFEKSLNLRAQKIGSIEKALA